MQGLKLDNEMVSLQKFNHPTSGLMRIIGEYNEDPAAPKGSAKVPHYKCQQVEGNKTYFMLPKADVKIYITEYLSQNK